LSRGDSAFLKNPSICLPADECFPNNLPPSQYVSSNEIEEHRSTFEIVAELNTIESKRLRTEEKVKEILGRL